MAPLCDALMTAFSAGPRMYAEPIVAMLLGPASCAEPQTPAATPEAERPRRPEPPDRPAMSLNGLASAEGLPVFGAEPPAAGAGEPVPGTAPAGAWPAGVCPAEEPPLPVDGPVQLPDCDGASDGDAVDVPDGAGVPVDGVPEDGVPEGCVPAGASGESDGLDGREGAAVSEEVPVSEEVGSGDGAGSV